MSTRLNHSFKINLSTLITPEKRALGMQMSGKLGRGILGVPSGAKYITVYADGGRIIFREWLPFDTANFKTLNIRSARRIFGL